MGYTREQSDKRQQYSKRVIIWGEAKMCPWIEELLENGSVIGLKNFSHETFKINAYAFTDFERKTSDNNCWKLEPRMIKIIKLSHLTESSHLMHIAIFRKKTFARQL